MQVVRKRAGPMWYKNLIVTQDDEDQLEARARPELQAQAWFTTRDWFGLTLCAPGLAEGTPRGGDPQR